METPAVKSIKDNKRVHTSPQDITVVEPNPAAASAEADSEHKDLLLSHDDVSRLAYSYWETRGCEAGSADEDWYRAEAELKARTANEYE
jgi:hypothetical protein